MDLSVVLVNKSQFILSITHFLCVLFQVPERVSRAEPMVKVCSGSAGVLDHSVSDGSSGAGDCQRSPPCLSGQLDYHISNNENKL